MDDIPIAKHKARIENFNNSNEADEPLIWGSNPLRISWTKKQ